MNIHEQVTIVGPRHPQKRLLSVREFSSLYGIGVTKTYEFMKLGQLRSVKAGHSTRIRTEDAEAWAANLPSRSS